MPAAITAPHQVCNIALANVGNARIINSLEENTLEARMCKVHYAPTRDELLEVFPWRFAAKRATLAALSGQERSGWTYTYQLPTDCIAPRRIYPGARSVNPDEEVPFEIETVSAGATVSGLCLLTDKEEAELLYTAECPAVVLWTPLFVQAVAWHLSMKLALVVPVKPELASGLERKAAVALARAKEAQMNARQRDPAPLSEYTLRR